MEVPPHFTLSNLSISLNPPILRLSPSKPSLFIGSLQPYAPPLDLVSSFSLLPGSVSEEKHTVPTEIEARSDSGRGNPTPRMRRRARSKDFNTDQTAGQPRNRKSENSAGDEVSEQGETSVVNITIL
ncbi:hypothetical protein V2J09_013365 [Rumex salicifolius]